MTKKSKKTFIFIASAIFAIAVFYAAFMLPSGVFQGRIIRDSGDILTDSNVTTRKVREPKPVREPKGGGGTKVQIESSLSAVSESRAIPPAILTGGSKNVLVAKYTFNATGEAFNVNRLTIINDDNDDFGFDDPIDTNVIEKVTISYPDNTGTSLSAVGILTQGKYTFNNLGFYVDKDSSAVLNVYADIKAITSGTFNLSGKMFRLGLQENNTSATFEAMGVSTGNAAYLDTAGSIASADVVPDFVVRKAKPVFSKGAQYSTSMPTTSGDLYKFSVTAQGGDVSFARLVFEVTTTGLNGGMYDDIYDWDFRNNFGSVPGHHIWGQATRGIPAVVHLNGAMLGSGLKDCDISGNGVEDGLYYIVITFDQEQVITNGTTQSYTLRASVSGATTDDSLSVQLVNDDGVSVSGITSNYDNDSGAGNTTHLVGNGMSGDALFADSTKYFGDSLNLVTGRNIVWSDMAGGDLTSDSPGSAVSAVHIYPTVSGSGTAGMGTVGSYSGTVDWTNGYLLSLSALGPFNFKK